MDGALRMGYRGMKGHFAGVHCDRSNRGEEKTAEIDCTAYAVVVRIGSFHVFDPSSCLFRTVSSVDAGRIRHCLDVQSEMPGGQTHLNVNLIGVRTLSEMQDRIGDAARRATPGTWLVGGGWDHSLWASRELPVRRDLDLVGNGHPAFFRRVDGHIGKDSS